MTDKEQQQELLILREQHKSDLKHVLSSPEGERFVLRLLSSGHLFDRQQVNEPLFMAYLEGKKATALEILDEIKLLDDNRNQASLIIAKLVKQGY